MEDYIYTFIFYPGRTIEAGPTSELKGVHISTHWTQVSAHVHTFYAHFFFRSWPWQRWSEYGLRELSRTNAVLEFVFQ